MMGRTLAEAANVRGPSPTPALDTHDTHDTHDALDALGRDADDVVGALGAPPIDALETLADALRR